MSQAPGPVIESSGGGSRTGTGVGSAALTGSTLDSQSRPGGGGESLEACMGFWDSGTHMTRAEWHRACQRTRNRLDLMRMP